MSLNLKSFIRLANFYSFSREFIDENKGNLQWKRDDALNLSKLNVYSPVV